MPKFEEVLLEPDDEPEPCPCCDFHSWLRGVIRTKKQITWVLWCAGCGKPLDGKTTAL